MDNWFTIEQMNRDTFSISEYKLWKKHIVIYYVGEKYAILIDTGFRRFQHQKKVWTL